MVLPEIVAAGIYNSQYAVKNIAVSKNRVTSMFEIELPMESGGISYIDSNAMPITPNMLICAKPGQLRHTKFPYKCYFVHMILHGDGLQDTLMNMPDFLETDKSDVYKALFTRLTRHFNSGADNEILIQSIILELIHNIRQDASVPNHQRKQKNNHHIIIRRALKYIHDHLTEDLCLETVADSVSLSPIHFHNVFKAAVGMTLREYVEEQRIKKAINLLITTDFSLTEIAYDCGFSSQSYFSYVFKRKMEQTPREYVQALSNNYEI